jgi:light-regulated signal transduction histidine kinase (bacteriophytochrome)
MDSRGNGRQRATLESSVAIMAAAIAVRSMRKRIRAMRATIDQAIRDQTYTTRIAPQPGELGPFADALNQLLDQMQTRDATLRRRTNELEGANKDLEAFASAVSHDLRAPLGSIAGFAQALDEDCRDRLDDVGKECVHWIRQSADQMSLLIEGLLQMARLSRVEMQRSDVDLSSMAGRIAATLQHTHPDRVVDFRIETGIVAYGDETLLAAVLENLINNAWKFTSKRPHARIEIGVQQDGGPPAFFVRDNGAGFDPQHAAKMFRPFQRLHSEREFTGTGIGLATVQKIVQRHGGRAWAEGEPEKGATIYFTTGSHEAVA